jgi:hypothetical protein
VLRHAVDAAMTLVPPLVFVTVRRPAKLRSMLPALTLMKTTLNHISLKKIQISPEKVHSTSFSGDIINRVLIMNNIARSCV